MIKLKMDEVFDLIKALIVTALFLYASFHQWLGLIEWVSK